MSIISTFYNKYLFLLDNEVLYNATQWAKSPKKQPEEVRFC